METAKPKASSNRTTKEDHNAEMEEVPQIRIKKSGKEEEKKSPIERREEEEEKKGPSNGF